MRIEPLHRRAFLQSLVGGSLVMPGILSELMAQSDPLAPRQPHFPGRAKRVIFLYMTGGVSHLETFDPKPKLAKDAGKLIKGRMLLAPQFKFHRGGKSGTPVSEIFPHLADCMDDICVIRSMKGDHSEHGQATLGAHTGSVTFTRPSLGSWISYGLGTENRNLPSFVVIAPHLPYMGSQVWASDFLPGCHQGLRVIPGKEPIRDLRPRAPSAEIQEMELSLLQRLNRLHQEKRDPDPLLEARIRSFETAYGMQSAMPEVMDLTKESKAILRLYGIEPGKQGFGWQCLMARRLAERGVRFIELIDTGSSNNWDSHGNMEEHRKRARYVDRPIAGLLKDLKSRGMLEETLVVWTSEFGRTPHRDGTKGRMHHGPAFSSWLAGGGIKGGIAYGSTDDYGYDVAENLCHVHDFHATILHQLGFDHERLTYRHAGRDFRLTDVHGKVIKDILA